MANIRVASPVIDENMITKESGPSFWNESAVAVQRTVKLRKEWRYKIRIDSSASFSGIQGTALIPYLERTLEAGRGWSFSATQVLEQELPFDIPARSEARSVIEWRPLSSSGLLMTGTAQPDVPFSVDVGYTFNVALEVQVLK
jgi:hypothetical protein